ncbi:integrase core domain-containing protein, partial [Escherichia coli]|uniref:integrase core domain-containing protein n=1 Tax=Escherichia coli TaxID=562 RepID=UPI0035B54061
DALEQALWARRPSGTIHHSDKGSQYVSLAYTERLKEAKLLASTGSTGDSYDNAMAESINGLYKAEVIHRKSWKNRAEVELATLTWVDWLNRPGFPGECFICELRLPDHCFRWKHNKLFLLLPEEYGPAFPAIVD